MMLARQESRIHQKSKLYEDSLKVSNLRQDSVSSKSIQSHHKRSAKFYKDILDHAESRKTINEETKGNMMHKLKSMRSTSRDSKSRLESKKNNIPDNRSNISYNKYNMDADLEPVEDADENSTSYHVSMQQSNQNQNIRASRDFYKNDEEEVKIMLDDKSVSEDHDEHDDQENNNHNEESSPFEAVPKLTLKRDPTEMSALNLNEDQFDIEADYDDIVEHDDLYSDRETSYKDDKSMISNTKPVKNREKVNFKLYDYPKATFTPKVFDQIDEVNENSNPTSRESDEKNNSLKKKQSSKRNSKNISQDDSDLIRDFISKNHELDISAIRNDRNSKNNIEIKDLDSDFFKYSFKVNPEEQDKEKPLEEALLDYEEKSTISNVEQNSIQKLNMPENTMNKRSSSDRRKKYASNVSFSQVCIIQI